MRMADGTAKKVKEVRKGDAVRTPSGTLLLDVVGCGMLLFVISYCWMLGAGF